MILHLAYLRFYFYLIFTTCYLWVIRTGCDVICVSLRSFPAVNDLVRRTQRTIGAGRPKEKRPEKIYGPDRVLALCSFVSCLLFMIYPSLFFFFTLFSFLFFFFLPHEMIFISIPIIPHHRRFFPPAWHTFLECDFGLLTLDPPLLDAPVAASPLGSRSAIHSPATRILPVYAQ